MYRIAALTLVSVVLTACGTDMLAPGDAPAGTAPLASATVAFNPQPEPPADVLPFSVTPTRDGRWTGRFGAGGTLAVTTVSAVRRDGVLLLVQRWTFIAEPTHPPEPVLPGTVSMSGTLDYESGALELTGEADGILVRALGELTTGPAGASIGGELMFNPQPEPPAAPARR